MPGGRRKLVAKGELSQGKQGLNEAPVLEQTEGREGGKQRRGRKEEEEGKERQDGTKDLQRT